MTAKKKKKTTSTVTKKVVKNTVKKNTHRKRKKHRHVDEYSQVIKKEKPTKNPLSPFAPKPIKVFFSSQLKEEKIVLMLHRHPVTQLKKILVILLLALMPIIFFSTGMFSFFTPPYNIAFILGWYLIIIGVSFESFLVWFFSVYIVTDERIFDVDFYNLIQKNISSAKIDNIEDVTIVSGGIASSLFDFGTINIQTSAEKNEFEFELVPQPAKVAKILNELILEEEREKIEGRTH